MIVRDLIARFGIDFDERSAKEAESKTNNALSGLKKLGITIGAGAVAYGFNKLVNMASDTVEDLNVVNQAFRENAGEVQAWANEFSDAAGRSNFELLRMAGNLGAALTPMMEDNAEASAEMSKNLTQLAVDLGSLYNRRDEEALNAIRSGLTGEMMPLKKLGIIMNEATLKAFALETGVKKAYKAMTEAEKTTLRYNYIMAKSSIAHGDAARTSEEYANASKATVAALKDLGTIAGLVVLPAMKWLMNAARGLVQGMQKLAKETNIIKALMITLGALVIGLGIKFQAAFLPLILPVLKLALIIALVALAVEDFITFLQGGDSVIGRFIDTIFGPGSATAAVKALKDAFQLLKIIWIQDVLPALKKVKKAISEFLQIVLPEMQKNWTEMTEILGQVWDDWIDRIAGSIEWLVGKIETLIGWGKQAASFFGVDMGEQIGAPGTEPPKGGGASRGAYIPLPAGAGAGGAIGAPISSTTSVTVQGNASSQLADEIAFKTSRAVDNSLKRARGALTQRKRK